MKFQLPKIGMRMVKTAIAVFLCLLVNLIWTESIPLFSTMTAVLCMQPYLSNSKEVAIDRVVGCFVGGIIGMLVLDFFQSYVPSLLLQYSIVGAFIILLIYITVLMNHTSASAFTCIVFLGTTVMVEPGAIPLEIAATRIINTLIGIFIALLVNAFHVPMKKNKTVLFVSDLDNTITHSDGFLSAYTEFHLNTMLDSGMWFTIITDRTPATLLPMVENLNLNLPVIAMNGAVLYDTKDQTYSHSIPLERSVSDAVEAVFDDLDYNCFIHSIINETMHIYYGQFRNVVEERFYHRLRKTPYKNYIFGELPEGKRAVCITSINKNRVIDRIAAAIRQLDISGRLTLVSYPYKRQEGYSVLEIYSSEATRENAVKRLKEDLSLKQAVAFSSTKWDVPLFKALGRGYAVENADQNLKEIASKIIGTAESDSVVKMIERLYTRRGKI